jgi:hypothetical protein
MHAGKHIAIVGLGPSMLDFVNLTKGLGGRAPLVDEVWGINAVGDVLKCDRIFHMDDVRVQERRAELKPKGNIAHMLNWMRETSLPIVTSRLHPDYPTLEEFPLERFVNEVGYAYFNNTCAYAVGYAILHGVAKISMFGCDFTYANAHFAEKGRACVEYWLGFARARGIDICIAGGSSLMDSCTPQDHLYGYDTLNVEIVEDADDGPIKVTMTPRDEFATAEEIERRYDHAHHPNPLVSGHAA